MPSGAIGSVGGVGYMIPLLDTDSPLPHNPDNHNHHFWVALAVEDMEYWYPSGPIVQSLGTYAGISKSSYLNVVSFGITVEVFKLN